MCDCVRVVCDNLRIDRSVLDATDCRTNVQTAPVINRFPTKCVAVIAALGLLTARLLSIAIRRKHIACTCNRYTGDWRYAWLTADCTFR